MDTNPGYAEVAKYAETNTTHPKRVLIAFHIRSGQYDLALELLASDNNTPVPSDGETPAPSSYPDLQLMIEHLRQVETPIPTAE